MQSVIQIVRRVWGLAVFLLGLDENRNVLSFANAESIFPHCASTILERDASPRTVACHRPKQQQKYHCKGQQKIPALHCLGETNVAAFFGLCFWCFFFFFFSPHRGSFCSFPNSSKDICLQLQKQDVSIAALARAAAAATSLQRRKLSTR